MSPTSNAEAAEPAELAEKRVFPGFCGFCGFCVDRRLFHVQQFDVEQQRRVRRDRAAGAAGAISELRRDDERPLAADLHAREALIPALNHLAGAEFEFEWVVAIARAVELLAV